MKSPTSGLQGAHDHVRRDSALAARVPYLTQIVAFRNQLIHGYAMVKHGMVRNVIQADIPIRMEVVQALLAERRDG